MDISTAKSSSKQPRRKPCRYIGKVLLGSAIIFMSTGFSFDAEAGGHGKHYYGDRHGGHGYRHGYSHGYRSGHGHHRGHSDHGAYLVGGIILGSLISHAYQRRHEPYFMRETTTEVTRQSRVVRGTAETPVARRLFKDRYGDCFERSYDSAGNEVLVELDPNECAW